MPPVDRAKKAMDCKKNRRWTITMLFAGMAPGIMPWLPVPSADASEPPLTRMTVPHQLSVPEVATTNAPKSTLGFRNGSRGWSEGQDRFIGPVLQLLPPQLNESSSKEASVTETTASAPRMVTRSDAQLGTVQRTWETSPVDARPKRENALVLQSPVQSPVKSPASSIVQATPSPLTASPSTYEPGSLPSGLIANPAMTAGNRTSTLPTMTAPKDPLPLRDPAPVQRPVSSIGSGVASTPQAIEEDEMQRLAEEIATIIEKRMDSRAEAIATPPAKASTRVAHPSENNEVELVGPEIKPSIAPEKPLVSRSTARDSLAPALKAMQPDNSSVSRVPLKTLEIASSSLGDDESQRDDLTPLERDATPIPQAKPTLKLANLDATGRAKAHGGKGAAAKLDPVIVNMQRPLQQCLQYYHAKRENADARSNWGMMHAIMVYGSETRLIARGRDYSTIAWMAGNNVCRGQRLMSVDRGKITAQEGVGLQGHQAQWLAILSLAGVPAEYPLYVGRTRFTVADLVQTEAATCAADKELTFTLIGLSHYLDTETSWQGADTRPWDFQRVIEHELAQPVVGSACGGTHRLMGFAHSLRKRRLEGRPVEGQWARSEAYLDDFVDYTYQLQNRDGSFSTAWFEAAEDNGNMDRKVQTTGHMTEFLLTHLPDERIVEPEVVRAVQFLLSTMLNNRTREWEIGPKGHALRTLAMYYERVYGDGPAIKTVQTAAQSTQRRSR